MDITAELVRDQIVADAVISDKLAAFNPYMGNLLEPICCHAEPSKWVAFLAFPMGPLNSDLSECIITLFKNKITFIWIPDISPFVYGETHHTVFKPSRLSSRTFATPIQQIVSSGPPNASKKS